MSDDLVRLRGYFGQSEVNCRGVLYAVSRWGTVVVPAEDVPSMLRTARFHVADENDPSASNATLADVAEVAWHLAPGREDSLNAFDATQKY